MKKLFLFLALILFFISVKAQTNIYQPFPSDSAIWLNVTTPNGSSSQFWNYAKWLGDTVINSKTYTKMYKNSGNAYYQPASALNWIYIGGIRQDILNEKTYRIDLTGYEQDISVSQHLVVGDSMPYSAHSPALITNIDSVLMGQKYHKRYNSHDSGYVNSHSYVVGVGEDGASSPTANTILECFTVNNVNQFAFPPPFCKLTSINRFENLTDLILHPNPAQNNFTIETNLSEKQMLFVFDVNGKLVLSQFIQGKTTIDASNLNAGVYSLNITSNQGTQTKKLVIVK